MKPWYDYVAALVACAFGVGVFWAGWAAAVTGDWPCRRRACGRRAGIKDQQDALLERMPPTSHAGEAISTDKEKESLPVRWQP